MSKTPAQLFNEKQKISKLGQSIQGDIDILLQKAKVLRTAIEDVIVRERHDPHSYTSNWPKETKPWGMDPLETFGDWDFNDRGLKQLGELRKDLITFEKQLKSTCKSVKTDDLKSIRKWPKELQKSYSDVQKKLKSARCEYNNLPKHPEYGYTGFTKKVCVGSWGYNALGAALKNPSWKVLDAAIKVDRGIVSKISQLLRNIALIMAEIAKKTVVPRLKKAFQRSAPDKLEHRAVRISENKKFSK